MRVRLLRNYSLRLALTYMALFGMSVLLLLGFIYWSTAAYMSRQADATIEADITGLAERYDLTGLAGLMELIEERLSRQPTGLAIYLLTTERFTRIAGNLDRWPAVTPDAAGWLDFELANAGERGEDVHRARARSFALTGGFHLLVGRDIAPLVETKHRIMLALAWGLAITLVLGGWGGVMMSRGMTRRIEAINTTSREIMTGDLSRRIPLRGSGDELDRLSDNLNAMLEQIQRLMENIKRVSDNIAHDLRTPLGRLRNELEGLRDELRNAKLDTTHADQTLAEADALLDTFNALLRIARIESGRRREAFETLDMAAVVRDVAEFYEPLAEARGQRLMLDIGEALCLTGDRDLLFQTIANLLDNAIKYTPEGGAIAVELRSTGPGRGQLTISDNGPGIPPAFRDTVFQRFFRLEESRSTPGSGLGLSLVEAVTRLHNIAVSIEDNRPGTRLLLDFSCTPCASG